MQYTVISRTRCATRLERPTQLAKLVRFCSEDEDNAKILRDLFEGTGIMSAIDHTKIESANDPETRAIDYEASRIARQAADALRQSRRVCSTFLHKLW